MIKGIDASTDLTSYAQDIKQAGYSFVGRYYDYRNPPTMPTKCLTLSEAQALSNAGLSIVMLWEYGGVDISYYTEEQGTSDAQQALTSARNLGQPAGSAIYFCADCNPDAIALANAVIPYFNSVNTEFLGSGYQVGVYGSGLTCFTLLSQPFSQLHSQQLAVYSWLSESTTYHGTSLFDQYNLYNIKQSIEPNSFSTSPGADSDTSINGNIGSFTLSSSSSAQPVAKA